MADLTNSQSVPRAAAASTNSRFMQTTVSSALLGRFGYDGAGEIAEVVREAAISVGYRLPGDHAFAPTLEVLTDLKLSSLRAVHRAFEGSRLEAGLIGWMEKNGLEFKPEAFDLESEAAAVKAGTSAYFSAPDAVPSTEDTATPDAEPTVSASGDPSKTVDSIAGSGSGPSGLGGPGGF